MYNNIGLIRANHFQNYLLASMSDGLEEKNDPFKYVSFSSPFN